MKKFSKFLFSLILATMLLSAFIVISSAESEYTAGDFRYETSGNYLSVKEYIGNSSSVSIPSKVTVNGRSLTVKYISSYAFYENYNLKSLTIPSSIQEIGYKAFAYCTNLTTVNYNAITLSSNPDTAFKGTGTNSGYTVTFGSTVKKIPSYLFYTNESYNAGSGDYAHVKFVTIGANVTEIGSSAFENCYDLKKCDVQSKSISTIGSYAFSGCSKLKVYCYPSTKTYSTFGNYGIKCATYPVPAKVAGLKASAVKKTSIKLTWNKAKNAKYYVVQQSTDGKTWKTLATVTANSYNVSGLKTATKYQFRVKGMDSTKKYSGSYSAVLKTGTLTVAPSVTLKSTKAKTAVANWKKVIGAKSYIVYKSTDNKKWTKVGETTKLTYNLTKPTGGKKIYVKVVAVNAYGKNSAYSAVKNVTVKK